LSEQLEKARTEDYRSWFGFLFLLPCWLSLCLYFGRSFLEHASGIAIWAAAVASALLFLVVQGFWILFVPAAVSLALAAATWLAIIWMAWHGKLLF
jgi:hypothetical protein